MRNPQQMASIKGSLYTLTVTDMVFPLKMHLKLIPTKTSSSVPIKLLKALSQPWLIPGNYKKEF